MDSTYASIEQATIRELSLEEGGEAVEPVDDAAEDADEVTHLLKQEPVDAGEEGEEDNNKVKYFNKQ